MGGKKLLLLYKRWDKSNKSTSKLHEVFGTFVHEFTQRFSDVSGIPSAPSIWLCGLVVVWRLLCKQRVTGD